MNILFIIQQLIGGGAERITTTLASALAERHNVYIVTYYTGESYYIDDKVKLITLNLKRSKNFFERLYNMNVARSKLKRIKKELKIDCAISMLVSANADNVFSKANEKVIVSIRSKYSVLPKGIKYFLNGFSAKHADCVVTLSKGVEKDQRVNFHTPSEKLVTIYNPCDYNRISLLSKEPTADSIFDDLRNKFEYIVITAGRSVFAKGQWHLIRAFSKVIKNNPNAALVLLGKGEMDEELDKLIIDLHLENNVKKLGFKENIYAYLDKSDLFAFTSLYEGFGNVLLEAMACNLPILSCDCDAGPRELIAPDSDLNINAKDIELCKYGVLSPMMDWKVYGADEPLTYEEDVFADAILMLLSHKELLNKYRNESQKRVQDFSIDNIVEQWENIL